MKVDVACNRRFIRQKYVQRVALLSFVGMESYRRRGRVVQKSRATYTSHKTSCRGRAQTVSISTCSLLFSEKHINCLTLQVNSPLFLLIIAIIIYQYMRRVDVPENSCHQTSYKESSNESINCICQHKDQLQMSILEISIAVFPTLTLVWNYLQVNLQFRRLGGQGQITKCRFVLPC